MLDHRKNIPSLRAVTMPERATAQKARESWHLWGIISEFVEATERLSEIRPAVSIFGSARSTPEAPMYQMTVEIARKLSDAGFAVISGGGPGIMKRPTAAPTKALHRRSGSTSNCLSNSTAIRIRTSRCAFATFCAQGGVRQIRRGVRRTAGRLRHGRRTVRGADADADRQGNRCRWCSSARVSGAG